jgi:aspartate beta-hydroxylase
VGSLDLVMTDTIVSLVRAAGDAARAGRWAEAEDLWHGVRRQEPGHPQALYSLGVHAFQRGDIKGAIELLSLAAQAAPLDPTVQLSLSVAWRESGNGDGEWACIMAALTANPYFLAALLAKADFLERMGRTKIAAEAYANALKVAPPPERWPDALRTQLHHAQDVYSRYTQAFSAYLDRELALPRAALDAASASRWTEAAAIMTGQSQPYPSQSNQLAVPRLAAIPFYDRSHFAWAQALEAQTSAIHDELVAALAHERDAFVPYIGYLPGDPVNQWGELNHSDRWSTYPLWRNGVANTDNLARCPRTAQALVDAELVEIDGICPNAMFSALAPHTHIPPHHGETNARLVVHLPLIVPDGCLYRVGFEQRQWRVGEVLIFDDTIEHEARNDSDALRVVLIFDVWNPLLTPDERDMVCAMMAAKNAFQPS